MLLRMLKKPASGVLTSHASQSRRCGLRDSTVKRNHTGGVYPFTKTNLMGERLTRSAVCTSSPLLALRPCWATFLSILTLCWRSHRTEHSSHIINIRRCFSPANNRNRLLQFVAITFDDGLCLWAADKFHECFCRLVVFPLRQQNHILSDRFV